MTPHRFACGIRTFNNQPSCKAGNLISRIDVIWCDHRNNQKTETTWTVSYPEGFNNPEELMCNPGELIDGVDSVLGEGDLDYLTYCGQEGSGNCDCGGYYNYYGGMCNGYLDKSLNYIIIGSQCDNSYGDPLNGIQKHCWCGKINIRKFQGIKQVKIRCSPFDSKPKSSSQWKETSWLSLQSSPGIPPVSHITYHDEYFICGINFLGGQSYGRAFVKTELQFCELIKCEETLSAINPAPDFKILIQPGSLSKASKQIFREYFLNTDNKEYCGIISCDLIGTTSNDVQIDTQKIYINEDPTQEISFPNVFLTCKNDAVTVSTTIFEIEAKCTNNEQISFPVNVQKDQMMYASADVSLRAKFIFTSFQTISIACQVQRYYIYKSLTSLVAPGEFQETSFVETQTIGLKNSNTFSIEVKDGENPYQSSFIIYAEALGGSTQNSPPLTLTTKCPDYLTYEFDQNPSTFLSTKASYLGANGSDATFEFPSWNPKLPKCTQVLAYSAVDVSPPNSVTYPSMNFCLRDPCPVLDFDSSTVQIITFRIGVTHSQGYFKSPQYSVQVYATQQSPQILYYLFDENQIGDLNYQATSSIKDILLDSGDKFVFSPFQCTTGCVITNYQVSSSGSSVVPIAGLSISNMEVSLADTSFLQSITFFIYTELQSSPSIFKFSNQLILNVVCGSEIIQFTQDSLVVPPYERGTGLKTYLISEIQGKVSTDKSECPIVGFSVASQTSRVQFSVNKFTIDTANSFKSVEQLKASTAKGISRDFQVTFIVCGNEKFLSRNLVIQKIVQKNEVLVITKAQYLNYFTLIDEDHSDCIATQIPSNLLMDETCSRPLNSEVHYSINSNGDLIFDTSYPFKMRSICLNLQKVINKEIQSQILKIEVLGSEIVSINKNDPINKLYFFQKTPQEINIRQEGYFFTSDSVNAPITTYKLVYKKGVYKDYTNTDVTLDSRGQIISVETDKAMIQTLFVQAATQFSPNMAYLQIDIKVCGYEKIQAKKQKVEYNFWKSVSQKQISRGEIENMFKVNDTDCGFDSFKNGSTYNEIFAKFEEQAFYFFPANSSSKDDDVFTLQIDAFTKGNQKASIDFVVTFLAANSLKGQILILNAPAFEQRPKTYDLFFLIGNQNYDFQQDEKIYLPKIIDPNGVEIKTAIDEKWQLSKNGMRVRPIPEWLFLVREGGQIKYIGVRYYSPKNAKKTVVIRDEGKYKLTFDLENVNGYRREEFIEFKLNITYLKAHLELDENTTFENLDDFVFSLYCVDEGNSDSCYEYGLKSITSFEISCLQNVTQLEFEYCYEVLKDTITLYYPQLFEEGQITENDGFQNNITRIFCKFDSKVFKDSHKKWIQSGRQYMKNFEILEVLSTTASYKLTGESIKTNQECSREKIFNTGDVKYFTEKLLSVIKNKKETQEQVVVIQEVQKQANLQKVLFFQKDYETFLQVKFDKPIQPINDFTQNLLAQRIKIFSYSGFDGSLYRGIYQNKGRILNESESTFSSQNLQFEWSFGNQTADSLLLKINFKNMNKVSQNVYGVRDQLEFLLMENQYIRDQEYKKPLDALSFDKKYSVQIKQLRVKDNSILVSEGAIKGSMILITIIQSNSLIMNILLSKSLQDIWALFSTQQITFHLMVLSVSSTVPSNIYTYNSYVSQFVQKDMYPTDEIFQYVFNFSESETINDQFEDLGYEGANFVELTGSLVINLILIIGSRIFLFIALMIIQKFFSRYQTGRRYGIQVQSMMEWSTLFEIYLQGYLELFMCTIISLKGLFTQDIYQTSSDKFSAVFMWITLIVLFMMPFLLAILIFRHKNELDNPEFAEKYGFIFRDLNTRTPQQAIFNLIYMLRRLVFVLIIIFLGNYCYFQIMAHTILTLAYTSYILWVKPFLEREMNYIQVFNEISVLCATYVLITLTDHNIDDVWRYKMGYCYILSSSANMLYNLQGIIHKTLFRTFPEINRGRKIKKFNEQYEKFIQQWLEKKAQASHKSVTDLEIYEHSKLIVQIREQKMKLKKLKHDQESQKKWLIQNQLSLLKLDEMSLEIVSLECILQMNIKNCFEQNQLSGIRWGQYLSGLNSIMYSSKVVGTSNLHIFPHNSPGMEPPFCFSALQSDVVKPFLRSHGLKNENGLSLELKKLLSKKVKEYNQIKLAKYLEKNGYYVQIIKGDGNCGPRAIATRIYGTPKKHISVRRQICQYVSCHPDYWGAQRGRANFLEFVSKKLSQRGEWFTDTEIKAAAKFYNIPIIIFTGKCSTPFFDLISEALTFEGNNEQPLYVHHLNGKHFNLLAHKSQLQFYKDLDLVPFKAADFIKVPKKHHQKKQLEVILEQEQSDQESEK